MINFPNMFRAGLVAVMLAMPTSVSADDVSVVLVHGAFSDGSAWRKVIPVLKDSGVPVSAVQLSLSALSDDAATVERLAELQDGPVVLVGHSYGGNVITEAGTHENVEALVFVAGLALDKGQSLSDLLEGQPAAAWQAEVRPDAAGYVRLTPKGIADYFAPDLPEEEAALIAATQGPIQYKINSEAPTAAAWSKRPTYYILAEHDQIVPPRLQAYFAQRMDAKITAVASSHVVMLSQPEVVADVILNAVAAASGN